MGLFRRRKEAEAAKRPYTAAVIAAAGSSRRMQGEDKIMALLGGSPVIARSVMQFELSGAIDEIVIVTREELVAPVGSLCRDCGFKKVREIVRGGATRAESVYRGLMHISREAELAAIRGELAEAGYLRARGTQRRQKPQKLPPLEYRSSDGYRILSGRSNVQNEQLTLRESDKRDIIARAVELAAKTGAAIPAVPVKDTLKRAQSGIITETPPRDELFAAQTPQVFSAELIKAALAKAVEDGAEITDDSSAVERLGMSVSLSEGSYENIKITTPGDLLLGAAILEGRDWA